MIVASTFSKAIQDGYQEGKGIDIKGNVQRVVFAGMGISAISGHLIADIAHDSGIPVHVCEESHLPSWVGKSCLVVVLSYTGDNDEAISAFSEAQKKGASILLVSRGGKLRELNRDYDYSFLKVPYDVDHLTFIPFSFFALFRVFEKKHLLKEHPFDVQAAAQLAGKEGYSEKAGGLAKSIGDSIPLVFSTQPSMALSWKRLMNYNGLACFSHTFPAVYYDDLYDIDKMPEGYYLIFITDKRLSPKARKRLDAVKKRLKETNRHFTELSLTGKDPLLNLFSALYLGIETTLAIIE